MTLYALSFHADYRCQHAGACCTSELLRNDVPSEIVEGPAAFPPAEYDGLVVPSDEWPPLLHPQMLMDADGYAAWERHMVARCAAEALSPESVIATLERDARLLRQYRPGNGSLAEAVARLPEPGVGAQPPPALAASLDRHREAMGAVPDGFEPRPDEGGLPKAFASWTAYQGRGVLTIVRGLEAALALVRVEAARQCRDAGRAHDADLLREAFRQADFILNHLAVSEDLARAWSRVEHGDDRAMVARSELAPDRA